MALPVSPKTTNVTVTRQLKGSPDRVYRAFTDPADVKRWFQPLRLIMDVKVDGLWNSEQEFEGKRWPHYGRFLKLERARLVEETWMSEATHGLESVVRVEISPKDGGSQVKLTHSGLPEDQGEAHRQGWTEILQSLDDLH
jgi:uncharacterized protein YndB with AHSA1/START domain